MTETTSKNQYSYPKQPLDYIDQKVIENSRETTLLTPLWAIEDCLSFPNKSKKRYSFKKSNPLELSRAADGMFVIHGFANPHCSQGSFTTNKAELPDDPCYDVILQNRCQNQIPTVVLYFPSTGTYYLP